MSGAWMDAKPVIIAAGVVLAWTAVRCWRDACGPRRWTRGLFWALFALPFLLGDAAKSVLDASMVHRLTGALVLGLGLLAGLGWSQPGSRADSPGQRAHRQAEADRLGHRLFWPALGIPALTVLLVLVGPHLSLAGQPWFEAKQLTLPALALACGGALLVAWRITGSSPAKALGHAQGMLETIGWPMLLPLMLAMLGGVFMASHTGQAVQQLVTRLVEPQQVLGLVVLYTFGMAAFTMVMGNAFAAFPVLSAGVALPFLIHGLGAPAVPVLSIGMLCGYCGTLMTPMAANFNIVPAALLELHDRQLVIKTQVPTALALLVSQTLLLYLLVR